MDSLLATRLRSYIVQFLQKAGEPLATQIPKNLVYDHPTVTSLVDYILTKLSTSHKSLNEEEEDLKARVRRSVEKYSGSFKPRATEYVAVTGTTGSLGSFLLDQLLDSPIVKRIYCLNRSSGQDTLQRQISSFKERALDSVKLEKAVGNRVVMLDVDLSQGNLSLSDPDYEEVSLFPNVSLNC